MSSLSHLALLHGDDQVAAALSFGFEREGTEVFRADSAESLDRALSKGSQLIITGAKSKDEASSQLALAHGVLLGSENKVPILYFGNAISRTDALAEGANEFLAQPAYIRDVVTLAKLMATPMVRRSQSISGELGEHFGIFYLVRALGAIHYTGVLTLIRGLRRGELRFFEGEVTSAQIGALHGLAALHQTLLWTNARFDLREEKVVRRRQIPMGRDELLRDCDRFLQEIQGIAGGLSPSAVLERAQDKDLGGLPEQVSQILALFDGTGSVADVIEDSPYRVFETLRIARRLAEQGFVRKTKKEAPKHLMHTALAIEEWLVGGEVGAPVAPEDSRPLGPAKGSPASPPTAGRDKKKRNKKGSKPPVENLALRHEQSWSDLLPSPQTSDDLSQVVPSTAAVGEIRTSRTKRSSEAPEAPRPEMNTQNLEEVGKIFVDDSLGATDFGSRGAVPEREGSPARWEEETSPQTRHAIKSAVPPGDEDEDEVEPDVPPLASARPKPAASSSALARAAESVFKATPAKEASPAVKASPAAASPAAKASPAAASAAVKASPAAASPAKASPAAASPAKAVAAAEESKASEKRIGIETQKLQPIKEAVPRRRADSVSGELKAIAVPAKEPTIDTSASTIVVEAEAEAPLEEPGRSEDPKAEASPESQSPASAYDPEEVRLAHLRVAQTARDAVAAVQAALHSSALKKKPAGQTPSPNIDTVDVAQAAEVAQAASTASSEVAHFSADEEAFFSRGTAEAKAPALAVENFEDLDEAYEVPRTFWQRFMADPDMAKRKKKRKK